jgi:hypothetical protein
VGCHIKFADEILNYKLPPQATLYGLKNNTESESLYAWALFSGLDVEYLSLGEDYDILEFTQKFPYATMIPQIMVDGQDIGNLDQFKDWLKFMI